MSCTPIQNCRCILVFSFTYPFEHSVVDGFCQGSKADALVLVVTFSHKIIANFNTKSSDALLQISRIDRHETGDLRLIKLIHKDIRAIV